MRKITAVDRVWAITDKAGNVMVCGSPRPKPLVFMSAANAKKSMSYYGLDGIAKIMVIYTAGEER